MMQTIITIAADTPVINSNNKIYFIKNGKTYHIPRKDQISQARKAGIDFRIGRDNIPETADYQPETYPRQTQLF